MSTPKRRRKTLRNPKPEMAARMLDAAAELIRQEVFPQLRVEEIAEQAGVSVGTFYQRRTADGLDYYMTSS